MDGIKIVGLGKSVPQKILTNDDLAQMVETNDEWIVSRTGIRTRHICEAESHQDLCLNAAQAAIADAGIEPDEIGACIVATVSADNVCPAAACLLQRDLGLPQDIPCFDLNAACTGFLEAMHVMECILNASARKFGLVIGCEELSRLVNWEDRSTCILFGDGAGAAVVKSSSEYAFTDTVLGCRGDEALLHIPGAGSEAPSVISMEGTAVFRFAVEMIPKCIDQVLVRKQASMDDVDCFVFHQANSRIIDHVVHKLHIPPEKCYKNIQEYGNTSAASIPLALAELKELKKIGPGAKVLMVGFGGGMTWGGTMVELA
ncbi:MAG: ketoacyl-ACP synthase III [Lachnospiraceae bacterium]|nr:ketoacyl-ACP synthase III [Lachnospiraceae bacterium]